MPKKAKTAANLLLALAIFKTAVILIVLGVISARDDQIDDVGKVMMAVWLGLYIPGIVLAIFSSVQLRAGHSVRAFGIIAMLLLLVPGDIVTILLIVLGFISLMSRETREWLAAKATSRCD